MLPTLSISVILALFPNEMISAMSTELIYWLSVLIPLVVMPVVLPMVVLLARRKRLIDSPNARKTQSRPVAVMGGTVMMLVLCTTAIVINLFYDISSLFPAFCVMVILYLFGMLDDTIGLSWQFKLGMQVFVILLLYYGGSYGVNSLFGLFGLDVLPEWLSLILTLFTGLLLLNAANFVDGIDGLASGLGVLAGLMMGYWNVRHGFITQALLSFSMVGTMSTFFIFNVFSNRYKMYMGDSGSLVLGLFIYMSACPNSYYALGNEFLADSYFVSFLLALFSAMIFDMVRVVVGRALNGKSPFHPDRTHLHHAYVDVGMTHLLATLKITLQNMAVLAIWYVTAILELNSALQYFIVLLAGVAFIWLPYIFLNLYKTSYRNMYAKISKRCKRRSDFLKSLTGWITPVIDGRFRTRIMHSIK